MSTELAITDDLIDSILESGKDKKTSSYPDRLGINTEPEDDDGNRLPLGAYTLKYNGKRIYLPTAELRFGAREQYRYQKYDSDAKKFFPVSVYEKEPWGEFPDTAGTFKCGKITGKDVKELTETEKDANKDKGDYTLVIFAQIDLKDAVYSDGSKVSEDTLWHSITLTYKGTRAVDVSNRIKDEYGDYARQERTLKLTKAKKDKVGTNTFYIIQFKLGNPSSLREDEEYVKYNLTTNEGIGYENEKVMEAHIAANKTDQDYENELNLVSEVE